MSSDARTIRRIITAGLLLAITLLLVFTRVGMIPMPTPAANATVAHVPAIIGGILEGPIVGLIVGLGFGLASFMSATIPLFKDPMVAIFPRLFIGVTSGLVFWALRRANRTLLSVMTAVLWLVLLLFSYQVWLTTQWLGIVVGVVATALCVGLFLWLQREDVEIVSLAIAAGVGSMTNTVLVLTMAVVLPAHYIPAEAAFGIGVTHGVPEVVASAVVVVAVVTALRQIGRPRGSRLSAEAVDQE